MTLLLAHPTPIIGDGLCAGLRAALDLDVTLVGSRSALLEEARSPATRTALVDEALVEGAVEDLCSALLAHDVAMIVMTDSREGLLDVLTAGVRGVVDLRGGMDGLVSAVQAVQEGLTHLPPHLLSTVLLELIVARRVESSVIPPPPTPLVGLRARPSSGTPAAADLSARPSSGTPAAADLSSREHEVLELLCAGADQTDIARSLTIATSTAKTHIARIMAKLGARTRVEAVDIAIRDGLIAAEEKRA